MKELDKFLKSTDYPEDVMLLKLRIPSIATLPDGVVETIYYYYSNKMYSAGWMTLDEEQISNFERWLDSEC